MGQREQDIIAEARITLNDTKEGSYKWSNERLFKLLSNGQDDMCRNIPMIVEKATIIMIGGIDEYKLPSCSVKLLYASSFNSDSSVSIQDKTVTSLTILSYDELERDNPEWESDYSTDLSAVVVNALSQQTVRPYPRVTEDAIVTPTLMVKYQALAVALDYDEDEQDSINELTINEMWDYGLTQYVIGMAFLDYGDQASISRSQVALGLYGKEATRAKKLANKSFAKRAVTTNYRAKVGRSYRNSNQRRGNGFGNSRFNY